MILTNFGSESNVDNSENPSNGDKIEQVTIVNGLFDKSSDCSRTITKIFKERIDEKGYTWTKVSGTTKNFYFEEFKKYYVWDVESEAQVKKAWESKASLRYSDMLRDIRGKEDKPPFFTEDAWRNFNLYWSLPKYKKIQEINTQNRLKGEGSSTHTGGSISYGEHAKKLESTLKRPPTPFEIFLHTHTKGHDNQTFVNARSTTIHDNMLRLREMNETIPASRENASLVVESALYDQAAGGENKKRVYGRGPKACDLKGKSIATTTSKANDELEDKCLTMERKIRKLTNKVNSLTQTLEIVCRLVGVPVLDFHSDNEGSYQAECAGDAHQDPNTSQSQADASEDHHDTPI